MYTDELKDRTCPDTDVVATLEHVASCEPCQQNARADVALAEHARKVTRSLTMVILTREPPSLTGAVLAQRYPGTRVVIGGALVPVPDRETPTAILAYCQAHNLDVTASCVVTRTVHHPIPTPTAVLS